MARAPSPLAALPATPAPAATSAGAAPAPIKVGFITKFPVDFYDTMVDAVKTVGRRPPRRRGRLRPGQERHRRRGRDRRHRVDDHPGREGDRHHPDQPERPGRARQGRRRPGIKVVLIDNDIPGLDRQVVGRRHRQPRRRQARRALARRALPAGAKHRRAAGPARQPVARRPGHGHAGRRSATAATVVAEPATDCDQTKGLNAAQDILTAQPRRHRHLRRLRPADHRRAAGDQGGRQEAGKISSSASTPSPDEITAIMAGDEAALGRPVPGQDGLARHRDRRRRPPRARPSSATSTPAPRW